MTLEELKARLFLLDVEVKSIPRNKPGLLRVWKGTRLLCKRDLHYSALHYSANATWCQFTKQQADEIIDAVIDANSEQKNYIWG